MICTSCFARIDDGFWDTAIRKLYRVNPNNDWIEACFMYAWPCSKNLVPTILYFWPYWCKTLSQCMFFLDSLNAFCLHVFIESLFPPFNRFVFFVNVSQKEFSYTAASDNLWSQLFKKSTFFFIYFNFDISLTWFIIFCFSYVAKDVSWVF